MNINSQTFYSNDNNLQVTPKKQLAYDSDHDTNDTSSQTSSSGKSKIMNINNIIEIDVKPKRKNFPTYQDKEKYVSEYKKKWKTELCKNFLLKGYCPYGDTCCFAHGQHELIAKTEFSQSYKTKPCKKYFINGYCPYGYRCQYLHLDIKECPQYYNFLFNFYKQKNMIVDTRLQNLFTNQVSYIKEKGELLPVSSRLPIFGKLETIQIQ